MNSPRSSYYRSPLSPRYNNLNFVQQEERTEGLGGQPGSWGEWKRKQLSPRSTSRWESPVWDKYFPTSPRTKKHWTSPGVKELEEVSEHKRQMSPRSYRSPVAPGVRSLSALSRKDTYY